MILRMKTYILVTRMFTDHSIHRTNLNCIYPVIEQISARYCALLSLFLSLDLAFTSLKIIK